MKIIRNLFALVMLFGIGYFLFKVGKDKNGHFVANIVTATANDSIFIFPNLVGPMDSTVVEPMHRSSWRKYSTGPNYGIAVLLLDTGNQSNWMGIAHAFKSFGIPFKFYLNVDSALKNDVVYAYPSADASLNPAILTKLTNFPQKGGILISQCIESGLNQVFGFRSVTGTNQNYKIRIADFNNPILKEFTDSKEREISLADPKMYKESEGTYNYAGLMGNPLMVYPSGNAFMTERDYPGGGKAYCFGMDLGYFALTCNDERGMEAFRTYVNSYEPTMDVIFRIVKNIYSMNSKTAVTLGPVQDNKKMTLCITHDIDYSRALVYELDYAKLEASEHVNATYFVQSKYLQDWNDLDFFNDTAVDVLKQLDSLKMEVASHSVSHSRMYENMAIGKGNERYPSYHPLVKSKWVTTGGTVLGELRVSKFLLDHFQNKNTRKVVSFRPGHLSLPYSLPQCEQATGYSYSSDVTANDVMSHMPYQLNYDRAYDEEVPVWEFPITIEDEELPRMDLRLDSALCVAHKISKYGGLMCVLIHPSEVVYKVKFERELLDSLKGIAHVATMRDFGDWWVARNNVQYFVSKNATGYELHVITPAPVNGLTFNVPQEWVASNNGQGIQQNGSSVYVKNVTNGMTINFTAK